MDSDHTDKDQLLRELIEAAMTDGINRFCREVLVENGYLEESVWGKDELLILKREIAKELTLGYIDHIRNAAKE